MLHRIYIHNYGCLVNFDWNLTDIKSCLLIGDNGSGKSTVGRALRVLSQIAKGRNRIGELIKPEDTFLKNPELPVRFEIEVSFQGKRYQYSLALEFPEGFYELRVVEEMLRVDGSILFSRERASVWLGRDKGKNAVPAFSLDWHQAALPMIQPRSEADPLQVFRDFLSSMLLLAPLPPLMKGTSEGKTLSPEYNLADYGRWFSGVLAQYPGAYLSVDRFAKTVMPSFKGLRNIPVGPKASSLIVQFENERGQFSLPFEELSDGEKCFLACALVIAANEYYGPLFCFWDEPDNYLSVAEVGYVVMELRRAFESRGQLVLTSHNPESISQFSHNNTFHLYRRSRLEPTNIRCVKDLEEKNVGRDFITSYIRGDLGE